MATIEEVNQTTADIVSALNLTNSTLDAVDTKLDEILAFIQGLQGNQPVTQAQLDALAALLNSAKDTAAAGQAKAEAVLTEADALDE